MGIRQFSWGCLFAFALSVTAVADTISGSAGAAFQSWAATNLNENGSPYWDNTSMDGVNRNVGFYLINAPTAPLSGAPGALPFWGNAYNTNTDSGGTADLNFSFQTPALSSDATLELEVATKSNVNEFGWYDTTDPSVLHPIFLGPDSPVTNATFSPSSGQYGFYLKSGNDGIFYTQSALNSNGDTNHQHFVVFEESAPAGVATYWIGVEDLTVAGLNGNENGAGDYNDMLIRISPLSVPEPSTAVLLLGGALVIRSLLRRRRE